jgi:iron complex outermembrane receptor protein
MQKINSTIGLLFWLCINAYSQVECSFSFKGQIIDSLTKAPIEASITIENPKIIGTSNTNGNFKIQNMCIGKYHAYVQTLGYKTQKVIFEIPNVQPIIIELQPLANNIHEFVFEEHKREEMEALNKQTINGNNLFISQGNNLGDALKKITGVSSLNTGSNISKPVIHGLHSNRVLILNNGIRHEGQNWGSEHAPEIDPNLAKNISIIKGANAVRYGSDAIAGVIIIEPNKLIDIHKLSAEINFSIQSNGRGGSTTSIIEYCHPKFQELKLRVQGTLQELGNVHTPTYLMNNTGVKAYNYSGATGWLKEKKGLEYFTSKYHSEIGIFKGAHIGNLSDLDSTFLLPQPRKEYINEFTYRIDRPMQMIEHSLHKIRLYDEWSNIGKFNMVMSFQSNYRQEFDAHKPRGLTSNPNKPELSFRLNTQTIDFTWEHLVKNGFSGTMGIVALSQDNSYQGRNLIPNYITRSAGVFAIEHYKKNKLEIEFGARYDYREMHVIKRNKNNSLYQPTYIYKIPSITLGVFYKQKKHILKSYIGTAFRAPSINELFINGVHHGNGTYEIGNENLKAEKAINSSINYNFTVTDKFTLQTEVYSNYIIDFIYLQAKKPSVLTVLGAFPTFEYQQCNARLTGNDFQMNYSLTKYLHLEAKSSILYAWNLSEKRWIELMPANKFEFGSILKSNIMNAEISYVYQAKQNRVTPAIDYAAPPPSYSLINMQVNKEFNSNKRKILLVVGVNNLLNKSYREYLNSYRYYANDLGRNINIKLKMNF